MRSSLVHFSVVAQSPHLVALSHRLILRMRRLSAPSHRLSVISHSSLEVRCGVVLPARCIAQATARARHPSLAVS